MSQRERQASGGQAATVLAPPVVVELPRLGPVAEVGARRELPWERLFSQATPAQQAELLALAARQGLVYAQQLPKVAAGPRTAAQADQGQRHHLLTQLAAGQTGDLQPLRAPAVALADDALDASQAEAVARALAASDVCLIQGLPGTGKSRVVAEIIRQAASRGERILFLAATTAALDCVLEQLVPLDSLFPLRCLDPNEHGEDLSPLLHCCTLDERLRSLPEQILPSARQAQAQAECSCRRREQEEALWPRLEGVAERMAQLQQQQAAWQRRRAEVPGQVAQEAAALAERTEAPGSAAFPRAVWACYQGHRQELAALAAAAAVLAEARAQAAQELTLLSGRLENLRPLAAAKSEGRWWSLAWWRATCHPSVRRRLPELEKLRTAAEASFQAAEQQARQQQDQGQQLERHRQEHLADLIAAETSRRLALLAAEEEVLHQQEDALQEQGRQLAEELERDQTRPVAILPEAVAGARALWRIQKRHDEEACRFAGQWTHFLEGTVRQLGERLPLLVNLVAGTMAGWANAKVFREGTPEASFDLLILEEADQVSEADSLKAARCAARWVLVGEPAWTEGRWVRPAGADRAPLLPSPPGGEGRVRGPARGVLSRNGFFQRLWDHLHCDPGRLPYSWGWEGDRLCCRLRPLSPEQRPWLESERLADAPDIELRILALPRARPVLAEVVFPPEMTVPQAKEFIFRELQELPIQPAGRSWCWLEDGEHLVLRLAEAPLGQATPVTVEPGVREWVGALAEPATAPGAVPNKSAAWFTCRLEFAKAAGWHRDQVHAWVHSHLPVTDLGRTVSLQIPYRMQADLSNVLSDLLFGGTYVVPRDCTPAEPSSKGAWPEDKRLCRSRAVEFVAVPPLRKENGKKSETRHKKNAAGKLSPGRLPGEGAGLELDLTVARPGDRLPADLRGDLPTRGFVNYPEAQAVVRKLEALVQEPALRALGNGPGPVLAVLALYAAQAELIRRLIKRSATLAGSGVPLVVGLPRAFRHREFHVVLLSLTRSHAHRPVSYGEQGAEVALAMTRARSQLILFGDPGTLVRRSRWQGGLEQLDEAAAAREGQLVGDLVRYLQGQGRHAQAFLLCESNGP